MPLTALERARAAYLWQLQDAHTSLNEQLADVRHVFAALLGEPACSLASPLDEARAAYLAQLLRLPDQDHRLRDLARLVAPLLLAGRCIAPSASLARQPRDAGQPRVLLKAVPGQRLSASSPPSRCWLQTRGA